MGSRRAGGRLLAGSASCPARIFPAAAVALAVDAAAAAAAHAANYQSPWQTARPALLPSAALTRGSPRSPRALAELYTLRSGPGFFSRSLAPFVLSRSFTLSLLRVLLACALLRVVSRYSDVRVRFSFDEDWASGRQQQRRRRQCRKPSWVRGLLVAGGCSRASRRGDSVAHLSSPRSFGRHGGCAPPVNRSLDGPFSRLVYVYMCMCVYTRRECLLAGDRETKSGQSKREREDLGREI